jgi:signal transduction histidine kinase
MMRSILDDFLDMSKIESGVLHFEKIGFELALLAKQCVQSMSTKAKEKGIRIRLRLNQVGLPRKGYADPTRIKQLILNLLTNAIKVSGRGSRCNPL